MEHALKSTWNSLKVYISSTYLEFFLFGNREKLSWQWLLHSETGHSDVILTIGYVQRLTGCRSNHPLNLCRSTLLPAPSTEARWIQALLPGFCTSMSSRSLFNRFDISKDFNSSKVLSFSSSWFLMLSSSSVWKSDSSDSRKICPATTGVPVEWSFTCSSEDKEV